MSEREHRQHLVDPTTTVVAAVAAELVDEHTSGVLRETELTYDAADPYAVSVVFPTSAGPVVWTFARELLADGAFEPLGDGDVHVWPCLGEHGSAVTIVELHGEEGADACVQLLTSEVLAFLAATEEVVPIGGESAHLDLDALCDELLPPIG